VALKFAAAGLALTAILLADSAFAQRNNFESLRQCERFAAIEFRKHNPQFRRFTIDRASAKTDKFAGNVGTQFVSTIFYGKALYDAGPGERTVRFICLHAGRQRGPVFVYTLGD
jgi:hypothetical protein